MVPCSYQAALRPLTWVLIKAMLLPVPLMARRFVSMASAPAKTKASHTHVPTSAVFKGPAHHCCHNKSRVQDFCTLTFEF